MPYEIVFDELADEELAKIKVYDRRWIIADIESQLRYEPSVETKRKKLLKGILVAGFEFEPPLRELKVSEFRAFYEIDENVKRVIVRSVRRKRPDQTIEDVLYETGNP